MMKIIGVTFLCISAFCYINIEACHSPAHGGFRDPGSNRTLTDEEVRRNLLSNHSLPESVIECVVNHNFGDSSRKRRNLEDLDSVLTQAGASREIKRECLSVSQLCLTAVMCIENLNLSNSNLSTSPTANVSRIINGPETTKKPLPVLVGAPLFPGIPGVHHRAKIYCRFCAESYCQFYRRCEGRFHRKTEDRKK